MLYSMELIRQKFILHYKYVLNNQTTDEFSRDTSKEHKNINNGGK